jgi:hypothetical protein
MLLMERSETILHAWLPTVRETVKHAVIFAKNPIAVALNASAAFQDRAETAHTLQNDIEAVGDFFSEVANMLMHAEVMTNDDIAKEMLTESTSGFSIETAFDDGPIKTALAGGDSEFLAHPVVQRYIWQIWNGGDWALVNFKQFWEASKSTRSFYKYVSEEVKFGKVELEVYKLMPMFREVASPDSMRRLPVVQFWYETILGVAFIWIAFDFIINRTEPGQSHPMDNISLYFFIAGNTFYEIGQIWEDADSYFADVWNRIDFVTYALFFTWASLSIAYEGDYEMELQAQRCLAMNGFLMCFRLLHIIRLSKILGPLVLTMLEMFT